MKPKYRTVVAGYATQQARDSLGPHIGDEILSVDVESADNRLSRLMMRLASSTPADATRAALDQLLNGGEDTMAFLRVSDQRGMSDITVARHIVGTEFPQRTDGAAVQVLAENIACIDFDRLEKRDVAAMLSTIAGTKAVVFDMRGYPRETAWEIAPQLARSDGNMLYVVQMYEIFASATPGVAKLRIEHPQNLANANGPAYGGRIPMLIDDRTMSQAEHTPLLFESVARVTLIRSPTDGVDGDLRHVQLPGRITVPYSGFEVVRADGRPLQRVGLQPDVIVKPTLAGLRGGRDEVLQAAIELLKSN